MLIGQSARLTWCLRILSQPLGLAIMQRMVGIMQRDRVTSVLALFCELNQGMKPSTWVKLKELPHPFSADEALLLCQESEDDWLAWIPSYGEAKLHRSQFIA